MRAIDSNVVNMIALAAAFGDAGTNNSGGGVVTISAAQNIITDTAVLGITITPPAALAAGAGWKLASDANFSVATVNPTYYTVNSVNPVLQFASVPGWNLPGNQSITVTPSVAMNITCDYTLAINLHGPTNFTYGTPLNLQPTTIATGSSAFSVSGNNIAANALLPSGSNSVMVTFTPEDQDNYGGPDSTNVALEVTRAPITVTASNVIWTWSNGQPTLGTYPIANLVGSDGISASDSIGGTPPGNYTIPIVPVLSDPNHRLTNYVVTVQTGILTVIQTGQLVTNGGFETGDFSGWTLSNNASAAWTE